ncbi:MAG: response regulator [Desulforhopalus sp.]
MNSFNFLLVDDENEYIEILALRLRQRGFEAKCNYSGKEALKQLEKDNTIDIIVLDVGMPYPDGINTLQAVKKNYPLVEVIMLTGHGSVHSAVKAIKLGAFDYLTKPCNLKDLISKAELAVLRRKKRQEKIFDVRIKPYITDEKRADLISRILDSKDTSSKI